MKVESTVPPHENFDITVTGEMCEVRLIENVIQKDADEDGQCKYEWDEYIIHMHNRPSLSNDICGNVPAWIEFAKNKDSESRASDIRSRRNELLADSDWTQAADSPLTPEEKQAWAEYRQGLRDIPSQEGFPYDVVYPIEP